VPDLTLTIGQLKITPLFWSLCLGFVFSSFSFWRRLKEDYSQEDIFGLTLLVVVFCLFFYWLPIFFWDQSLSLPFAFAGGFLAVKVWSSRFKMKVWEVYDALAPSVLIFLFCGGIGEFLISGSAWAGGYVVISLFGWIFWKFLRKRYRSFSWYKSGKIGFLFWAVCFLIFVLLLLLAFLRKDGLYFKLLIFSEALFSAGIIYFRSERSLQEDFKSIFYSKWQK